MQAGKIGEIILFFALIGLAYGNNLTRFELAATTEGGIFSLGLNMLGLVSFSDKKGEMGAQKRAGC